MADGRVNTRQRNSPEYQQRAQSSNRQGRGDSQEAANRLEHFTTNRPRTRRMMTVESLQRMVNNQLVDDLNRSLSSTHESSSQPPRSSNRSSRNTHFDSVVSSDRHSQADMEIPTNKNSVVESTAKPQVRKGFWFFKLPHFRTKPKVHPSNPGMF